MTSISRANKVLVIGLGIGAVVIALVLWVIGAPVWVAVLVALVISALLGFVVVTRAPSVVLRMVRAEPADPDRHERILHLVDGLCLANGVVRPEVMVIDDPAPNGLVAGRNERNTTVVVTEGLLDSLDRIELEGVVAHLLSRIRSNEVGNDTLAAVVVGVGLAPFGGLRLRTLRWVIGEHHAMRADIDGVAMTRYPPGLDSALVTIDTYPQSVRSGGRATQHLWVDEPVGSAEAAVHLRLDERIEVLQEL